MNIDLSSVFVLCLFISFISFCFSAAKLAPEFVNWDGLGKALIVAAFIVHFGG